VQVFKRLLGYCLTGETSERSLFILWGEGMNGKSTVIDIMKKIMRRMYCAIDEKVLMSQERKGGATPELIPLMTARLAVFAESEKQEKLNAVRVKSLTGNDDISARALYGNQMTFRPSCKILMLTNHKPEFDISDQAMLDRLKLIPFAARFATPDTAAGKKQAQANKEYVGKMLNEHLNELFSWMAQGASEWYADGFPPCTVLQQEMDKYVAELDILAQFIEDRCEVGEGADFRGSPTGLYQEFVGWCAEGNSKCLRKQDFAARLRKHGFTPKKSGSKRFYQGLRVIRVELANPRLLPL
jgi:putative DNA primase/helicase